MRELLRPWKLATLAVGVAGLLAGQYIWPAPDWGTGISLIMAGFAYLLAPWCMRVMLERQWRQWPLMAAATWWAVDGCYTVYWSLVDPQALFMRPANAPASLSLFWACGVLWMPRCDLRGLWPAWQRLRGLPPRR